MIVKLKFAATMLAVRLAASLFITPLPSFSVKRTGSFNDGDGDGYENVTLIEKWGRAASKFIAPTPSRLICQMLTNFVWSWILKDCIKVQEKKNKVVVFCLRRGAVVVA